MAERKKCRTCQVEKAFANYYKSYSKWDGDGHIAICKTCLRDHIKGRESDLRAVKEIMRVVDKPFVSVLWDQSVADKKETLGTYFKNVNLNSKDDNYDDSDITESPVYHETTPKVVQDELSTETKSEQPLKVTSEMIDKFGTGYTAEEYVAFERKYKRLINNYGEKTALHTEGLITYIRYRVKEELASAKGEVREAKEWGALASKAGQDAKINVSQLSKSDISGGVDVLSQMFEAVESEVGIIPLLPKIIEQPYDDADLIMWANINYNRRLEDKESVPYRDIWNFYDEMLGEYFSQQGMDEDEIKEYKAKRDNVFRDLGEIYTEPLYDDGDL